MNRKIILLAGFYLTATDNAYINAILDAGETTGHRKGGLTVTLEPTTKETEIERYKHRMIGKEWAEKIAHHTLKGKLYAVKITNTDKHTYHYVVEVVELRP